MFEGFDFAVPAIFVTVATVGIGGLFALGAWGIAAFNLDGSGNKGLRRFPTALYLFTASILSVLVGMAVLSVMPYEWEQYHILGARLNLAIYSCFLMISLAAVIISTVFLRGKHGLLKGVLLTGSVVLIATDALGSVVYMMSQPGRPLH